jgi:hypothetical protein
MPSDRTTNPEWREFEKLVARIEKLLAPLGASVKSPDRLIDKTTHQLREVDGTIRYQVGSVPILITIECRDRAATQDVTWIEQLAKKQESLGANETVAVSSTNFTKPAGKLAERSRIFLRTLQDVSGEEIAEWIKDINVEVELFEWRFLSMEVCFETDGPEIIEVSPTVNEEIQNTGYNAEVAFHSETGQPLRIEEIGGQFVAKGEYPHVPGIRPIGRISFEEPGYLIQTTNGKRKILYFQVMVEVNPARKSIPLKNIFRYGSPDGVIAQVAASEFSHAGKSFQLVVIRKEAE